MKNCDEEFNVAKNFQGGWGLTLKKSRKKYVIKKWGLNLFLG